MSGEGTRTRRGVRASLLGALTIALADPAGTERSTGVAPVVGGVAPTLGT